MVGYRDKFDALDHWIKPQGRKKLLNAALTDSYIAQTFHQPGALLSSANALSPRHVPIERSDRKNIGRSQFPINSFNKYSNNPLTQDAKINQSHKPQAEADLDRSESKHRDPLCMQETKKNIFSKILSPYVDRIYEDKVNPAIDAKNTSMYEEKVNKLAKRVQSATALFKRPMKRMDFREKTSNHICVVYSHFKNGKWICRPLITDIRTILENPMRYTLISREEYDEFGQGQRLLRNDEWITLDMKRPCVGQSKEQIYLLHQPDPQEALLLICQSNHPERIDNSALSQICSVRERIFKQPTNISCQKFPTASGFSPFRPLNPVSARTRLDSQRRKVYTRGNVDELGDRASFNDSEKFEVKDIWISPTSSNCDGIEAFSTADSQKNTDGDIYEAKGRQELIVPDCEKFEPNSPSSAMSFSSDVSKLEKGLTAISDEDLICLLENVPLAFNMARALHLKEGGADITTCFQPSNEVELSDQSLVGTLFQHAEEFGSQQDTDTQETTHEMEKKQQVSGFTQVLGYKGLKLIFDGFDIRKRISVADLVPKGNRFVAKAHSLTWMSQMCNLIYEDKLSSDSVNQIQNLPRSRFPVYVLSWMLRRFGLEGVAHQNLIDLVNCAKNFQQGSSDAHLFAQCFNEEYNAGQISVFLNCRSLLLSVSSRVQKDSGIWAHVIPADLLQSIASSILEFAPDHVKQSTRKRFLSLHSQWNSSDITGHWAGIHDALKILVEAYGEAHACMIKTLEEQYEELLADMSRGLPQDGCNGRPLDCAVPFPRMAQFLSQTAGVRCDLFESVTKSLLHNEEPDLKSQSGKDLSQPALIDLNDVIAMDTAVDLLGFDARWEQPWASDAVKVLADGSLLLCTLQTVDLLHRSGHVSRCKGAMHAVAKRNLALRARKKADLRKPLKPDYEIGDG